MSHNSDTTSRTNLHGIVWHLQPQLHKSWDTVLTLSKNRMQWFSKSHKPQAQKCFQEQAVCEHSLLWCSQMQVKALLHKEEATCEHDAEALLILKGLRQSGKVFCGRMFWTSSLLWALRSKTWSYGAALVPIDVAACKSGKVWYSYHPHMSLTGKALHFSDCSYDINMAP